MAEKGFGVKEINLIGASGTPTITSPNNINLNAANVAISTNVSVGGTMTVVGNISIGGTLTYEDVTNIDSVGLVTARDGVFIPDSKELKIGNTAGSPDLKLYHDASDSHIANTTGVFFIQNTGDLRIRVDNTDAAVHCVRNGAVELYHAGTKKLETSSSGATVTGTLSATTFSGSGASLTSLPAANLTGTLPAISGANLTNLPADTPTNSDIQVVYTVTANGSSAYRFAGNGVVSTADDPDLYLIRGQKYRFINNSGGSHPFQIRESSGGSAYSTGVTNNGAASGNIDFAPTFDSPAQLVYQCTSHGGMVGNIYLRDAAGGNINVGVTTFSGGNVSIPSGSFSLNAAGTSRFEIASIENAEIDGEIAHSGDTDTKISFDTNTIKFDTTGSERLRINSSGRVLIGTTNATTVGTVNTNLIVGSTTNNDEVGLTLNVMEGTNNRRVKFFLDDDDGVYGFDTTSSTGTAQFVVRHATSEKLRINSNGNLLVGSAAIQYAQAPFYASGTDPVIAAFHHSDGGTNDQARISLGALANNPPYNRGVNLVGLNNGNGHDFVVQCSASHSTGPGEKVRITSAGNVGIGVDNPAQRLVVHAGADNSDVAVFTGGDTSRGLKISTTANALNDQNIEYDAQGQYGQHIFKTGGTIVARFEHDNPGIVVENFQTGDGDNNAMAALQHDYNAWGLIFRNDWIDTDGGWGTFWAGSAGAAYRRETNDTNPNEYVFVGSGNKRFTFELGNGNQYNDGSITAPGYDYAEYFEWEDGNPSNEDRRGYSVFVNSNGKIEKATDSTNTSDIIGVISGTAMILGDGAVYDWQGKWKVDEWGTVITEDVKQVTWKDDDGNSHSYDEDKIPSGLTVPSDASYRQHSRRILNPDYDETKVYVPRDKRQEWDPVGLIGKVRVRDDSPKNPNWKFIKTVNGKKLWLIR